MGQSEASDSGVFQCEYYFKNLILIILKTITGLAEGIGMRIAH